MSRNRSTEWEIDGYAISVKVGDEHVTCSAFLKGTLFTASWMSTPELHASSVGSSGPSEEAIPTELLEAFLKARDLVLST